MNDRLLTTPRLLGWAVIIGAAGGLLATAYYAVLFTGFGAVWRGLVGLDPQHLPLSPGWRPTILLVTTVGGLLVGLSLKWLGTPGEIAAVVDNIHLERGRIDTRQTPSMVVASLLSIISGGSAGPEAPLVQIVGSLGSWIGDKLRLRGDMVRSLTFCGMGTALGAFFGAPLGGALFALEIPHRRGLEYYEALVPAVVSAIAGFFVFRSIVGYEGAIYDLPDVGHTTLLTVALGALLGLLGAGLGVLFILIFRTGERLVHPLIRHKVLLATLGGLLLGLIAQLCPAALFWGEFQIQGLIEAVPDLISNYGRGGAAALLLGIAGLKMLAITCTLQFGFRGGFIFPLFFVGAAAALGLTLLAPPAVTSHLPVTVAVLCLMAAVNVAVTRTPISTAVILTTLSGTHLLPAIVCACFVSFLLTDRFVLIRSQRSRQLAPPSRLAEDRAADALPPSVAQRSAPA